MSGEVVNRESVIGVSLFIFLALLRPFFSVSPLRSLCSLCVVSSLFVVCTVFSIFPRTLVLAVCAGCVLYGFCSLFVVHCWSKLFVGCVLGVSKYFEVSLASGSWRSEPGGAEPLTPVMNFLQ